MPGWKSSEDGPGFITEEQPQCSSNGLGHKAQTLPVEENVTQKLGHLEVRADEFPGSSATYRIFEVTSLYCLVVGLVKQCCAHSQYREADHKEMSGEDLILMLARNHLPF